jgi:alanyl-tRNA synthetase
VLGGVSPAGSPVLLAAGTPAAVEAGFDGAAIIKRTAPLIQGGGGGKPAMAQAGGKNPSGLDDALDAARTQLDDALDAARAQLDDALDAARTQALGS